MTDSRVIGKVSIRLTTVDTEHLNILHDYLTRQDRFIDRTEVIRFALSVASQSIVEELAEA